MDVSVRYKASSGNEYDLKAAYMRLKEANFHRFDWSVQGQEQRYGIHLTGFGRVPFEYDTKLIFRGPVDARKANIEALHEDFERDVVFMSPGTLYWGDYHIKCYIKSSSTYPGDRNVWTENDINIYCPYPFWIKDLTKSFFQEADITEQTFLDYDFDYDYDFSASESGIQQWNTGSIFPSEFTMTIFGEAANPRIAVNGWIYEIFDTLEANEYIILDSQNHSIVKYLANGTTQNIYDKRAKAQSVFEKMPAGVLNVSWNGSFGFDITLHLERSEPLCS